MGSGGRTSNLHGIDFFAMLDSHDRAWGGIASLRHFKTFDRAVLRESLVGAQERGRKVQNLEKRCRSKGATTPLCLLKELSGHTPLLVRFI